MLLAFIWVQVLLPLASRCVRDMRARELATMLHALAVLRHVPPRPLAAVMLDAARRVLPGCSARDVATLVWALGTLSAAQREQLPGSCGDGKERNERSGGGSSAWAGGAASSDGDPACVLRLRVPRTLLAELEAASCACMRGFNCQDLSQLAVGFARLQHVSGATWVHAYVQTVEDRLPSMEAQVRCRGLSLGME